MPFQKCIIPSCTKSQSCRGLCNSHYHEARKKIFSGEATWESLVHDDLAKSPGKRGRKTKHKPLSRPAMTISQVLDQANKVLSFLKNVEESVKIAKEAIKLLPEPYRTLATNEIISIMLPDTESWRLVVKSQN